MKTSENISEVIKALAKAQGQIKPAETDAVNPRFKSGYNSISSIWEAIKQPLTDNGLVVVQDITTEELSICVTTRIFHLSGEWIELGPLSIPVKDRDAQAFGSAITYGKKYSLCASLGVVRGEADDDGNLAVTKEKKPEPKMGSNEILMLETELVGLDELKKEILEKSKVKDLRDLEQRYFSGILSHIRAKKREATKDEE